jgi:NADP-dependent 3-hydroxy acid dehydrogenase YdfG
MHERLNERARSWVRMGSQERPFEGTTALVTGGGTGVGAAIALALAQEGAALHLLGRRPQQLEAIASEAHRMGVAATCHRADLSVASEQPELVRQLGHDLPQLDFLIQNAAAHSAGPIECGNVAELDALYHTNVRAPYLLAQLLLPKLKARQGQIVFINSSSGQTAKPMSAQYDATKHALKAIADSLRGEVNQYGVRVLSIYLGRTATAMQAQIHEREGKQYQPELLLQPEDVASVVVNALRLPRTAEVTDVHIRPMIKS